MCSYVLLIRAAILPYFFIVSVITRLIDNLKRPPEEIRAERLREWVKTVPNATPIRELTPRRRYRAAGVVENIRIDPSEGNGSVEATFTDGTGHMVAKWLGRPAISGIRLGAGLIVDGIVGTGPDDELVVLNPEYELTTVPE